MELQIIAIAIAIAIAIVVVVMIVTVVYKVLPFRDLGNKKPIIAFFPKYKKRIKNAISNELIENKLSEFGFKKIRTSSKESKYTRGSILGDISIKLSKVNIGVREITENEIELTIQAGWVAAFDTGDHWKFLSELSEKLENA